MRTFFKLFGLFLLATLLALSVLACDGEEAPASSSSSSSQPEPPPPCEHSFTPTEAGCYCSLCEETFEHELVDRVCTGCGYEEPCAHTFEPTPDGCYCDGCKETFTHTYVDGACSDCGFLEDKSVDYSKFVNPFITKYYHNAKAAISLTFDDAQLETGYIANEMLSRYGLNGTIFFILEYAGKNPHISDTVRWNAWMSAWQSIIAEGTLDIGNHSYHHYGYKLYAGQGTTVSGENFKTEIGDAHALLTTFFPNSRIISFATPGASYHADTGIALAEYGYRFNRVGGTGMNDPYSYSFNPYTTSACLYYTGASANTANGYVDNAIRNGMWFVEAYHYIATEDGTPAAGYDNDWAKTQGTMSREYCEEHFAYISQKVADGDIWCGTFNDVAAYVWERKYSTVKYTASTEDSLTLSLTCNELKDEAGYDHPLTIRVEVPSDWASVSVSQNGGAAVLYTSTVESGKTIVYLDAVPNAGDIVITSVAE